ncbi:CRPV-013 [Crowpox virus]|nr:CRPV-013 [Crowpox virus]
MLILNFPLLSINDAGITFPKLLSGNVLLPFTGRGVYEIF